MAGEYELVVVTSGSEESSSHKDQIEEVKKLIETEKGEVLDIEEWGKRELAYPIKKLTSGYYSIVSFRSDPNTPNKISEKMRLKEELLRYMIVKKEIEKTLKEKGKSKNIKTDKRLKPSKEV